MVDLIFPAKAPKYAKQTFFENQLNTWKMKIGRISDLLVTPCTSPTVGGTLVDLFVWYTAFFLNVPEAIVGVSSHDCSDNTWDKNKQLWAPLKGRGGGRHGRSGTPSNSGGEKAPGITNPAKGWQSAAFNFGNWIEKQGAKLLILDAALNLAINWQSTYLEWRGCGAPPAVMTSATIARDVVGAGEGEIRNDMIGHPGSVGIICGIGGFATTVPVGNLEMAGSCGDRPFLFVPYCPLGGIFFGIDKQGESDQGAMDQRVGSATNDSGIGATASARASFNSLGARSRTGSVWINRPSGSDCACQVDPGNFCTISGKTEGMITNQHQADPCSNFPMTGTAPRAR